LYHGEDDFWGNGEYGTDNKEEGAKDKGMDFYSPTPTVKNQPEILDYRMIKQDFQPESGNDSRGGWLRNLQRESWQMELFVAGGSLALLVALRGDSLAAYQAFQHQYDFSGLAIFIPYFGYAAINATITISIAHLCVNLVLRSFWIGIIGLRRATQNQNVDQLPYHPVFRQEFLRRVIKPDELIKRIDRISSTVFGLTYLIAFYFISLMAALVCIFAGFLLIQWVDQSFSQWVPRWLYRVVNFLVDGSVAGFIGLGVVYLFDFLGFGVLKRFRLTAWLYWPSYALYSRITFARWYRSLFYGLLLGPRGRWVHPTLSVYLIVWAVVLSLGYQNEIYLPDNAEGRYAEPHFYADELPGPYYLDKGAIPSKVIADDAYLELFLPYRPSDHELLAARCTDYRPQREVGYRVEGITLSINFLGIPIRLGQLAPESDPEAPLRCLRGLYQIRLDQTLLPEADPVYYRHPNQQELGILMMIPTDTLAPGRHTLHLNKLNLEEQNDSTVIQFENWQQIPFWVQ